MRCIYTLRCFGLVLFMTSCLAFASKQPEPSGGLLQFVSIESELFKPQRLKFEFTNIGNEPLVFHDPYGTVFFLEQGNGNVEQISHSNGERRFTNFVLLRPGESTFIWITTDAMDFGRVSPGRAVLSVKYLLKNLEIAVAANRLSLESVWGYERRLVRYESFPDFLWQLLHYRVFLDEHGVYWLLLMSKNAEISRWKIFTGSLTCSLDVNVRSQSLRFLGVL